MELHTVWNTLAVCLLPCTRKLAYRKGHVVRSPSAGIDDNQLAATCTAAPTRNRIVSRKFHGRFSAKANHRSEPTLAPVQDRWRWFSTVDMLHWIVAELWARLLYLRNEGKGEKAEAKGRKYFHNASLNILSLPAARSCCQLSRSEITLSVGGHSA